MKRTIKSIKMAPALAAAAIATTCFVGGTLARYKTTGTSSEDTVRTAKWTFTETNATLDISNLFKDENGVDMKSAGSDKIMAPSAGGSVVVNLSDILTNAGNGTETGYTVKLTAIGSETLTDADSDPIVYTLAKGDNAAVEYQTIDDLASAISAITPTKTAAGDLQNADKLTIGWKWENDDANDAADTALGAAGNLNASLSLQAEITQNIATK